MKQWALAILLVLAGVFVQPAWGQVVIQPGILQNPLSLVDNPEVQKDLQLSAEQVKKVGELKGKYLEGLKGLGFQEIAKRQQVTESARKGLGEILNAVQAGRLRQLELQQRGANVFQDPQVTRELVLTPDQQAAILKSLRGFGPRWLAVIQAAKGNQQEIQKKLAELNRGLVAEIVKGLTAQQQAKWQKMSGPPFAGTLPGAMPVFFVPNPRPQPVLSWHMNDLAAAQAEAKKTGKPIFVTFRCEA